MPGLIGYIEQFPPRPFRLQRQNGEVIDTELLGRVVPAADHIMVFRGHNVLQFVVRLADGHTDAVIADEHGGWIFNGESVALLDAAPWLE